MPSYFLNNKSRLLFAKVFHDIAAPIGVLNLCVDNIKKLPPESASLIENSIELLSQRINYLRIMLATNSPNCFDAANAIRALANLKNIKISFIIKNEYQGTYVRLILALTMVAIESLHRGGEISIDAENGLVMAQGSKCFIKVTV